MQAHVTVCHADRVLGPALALTGLHAVAAEPLDPCPALAVRAGGAGTVPATVVAADAGLALLRLGRDLGPVPRLGRAVAGEAWTAPGASGTVLEPGSRHLNSWGAEIEALRLRGEGRLVPGAPVTAHGVAVGVLLERDGDTWIAASTAEVFRRFPQLGWDALTGAARRPRDTGPDWADQPVTGIAAYDRLGTGRPA